MYRIKFLCVFIDGFTDSVHLFIYQRILAVGNVCFFICRWIYQQICVVGNVIDEIRIKNWDSLCTFISNFVSAFSLISRAHEPKATHCQSTTMPSLLPSETDRSHGCLPLSSAFHHCLSLVAKYRRRG